MAIKAVTVVRAGPQITRQSNCMPVLVACEKTCPSLTDGCDRGGAFWRDA
jgi:hypothetical protein